MIWKRILYTNILILLISTILTAQSSMHPVFPLKDKNNINVLKSGGPVSTYKTCGQCHDSQFIATHSFHSQAGLEDITKTDSGKYDRSWDYGSGPFGQWNPFYYRYLTLDDKTAPDMGVPDWVQVYGVRHAGGGPAEFEQLLSIEPAAKTLDPNTGAWKEWDWKKSGNEEMNCFLCHTGNPNNTDRIHEIQQGNFQWAATATLSNTGVVEKTKGEWRYQKNAFDAYGNVKKELLPIKDPSNENCGQCHGLVHSDNKQPLVFDDFSFSSWSTLTTGQVFSAQRISDSGLNLHNKKSLDRSWDVHTERLLDCVDCHYSVNNPIYYQEAADTRPDHLQFDARRQDFSDYVYRPSHQFASGRFDHNENYGMDVSSMRSCESCHDMLSTHNWLPYKEKHVQSMTCEACHVPQVNAPSQKVLDWTLISPNSEPRVEFRGIDEPVVKSNTFIKGYEPVLLPRKESDGRFKLAPYNLVTTWYWAIGDPERPVRFFDLKKAFLENNSYHTDIVKAFDADHDGNLSETEKRLDTPLKVKTAIQRLQAVGVENPVIRGDVQPYAIHHNVAEGEFATRDCETCHSQTSRISQSYELAGFVPLTGEKSNFISSLPVKFSGKIKIDDSRKMIYKPVVRSDGFYVLGHDKVIAVQWIGALTVIFVLIGILIHGGLRIKYTRRLKQKNFYYKNIYLYPIYERFWHWLQAFTIIGLIFTGLVIHAPDVFSFLNFAPAVIIHNMLGFILLINAFFAVFYYVTNGKIFGFLPEPQGFFNQAIQQAEYYLRGIFKGKHHPFEKNINRRLNPLQKITYLLILNVLLPLQIISGILIWGAQRWPHVAENLGGLGLLVPFHSLIAWFFAAFLIMHIYLATTGHKPLTHIQAMVTGWEEVVVKNGKETKDEK